MLEILPFLIHPLPFESRRTRKIKPVKGISKLLEAIFLYLDTLAVRTLARLESREWYILINRSLVLQGKAFLNPLRTETIERTIDPLLVKAFPNFSHRASTMVHGLRGKKAYGYEYFLNLKSPSNVEKRERNTWLCWLGRKPSWDIKSNPGSLHERYCTVRTSSSVSNRTRHSGAVKEQRLNKKRKSKERFTPPSPVLLRGHTGYDLDGATSS